MIYKLPVRNITMWLTLSASVISATTLVGETCSQLVDTRRPATINPNMDIV